MITLSFSYKMLVLEPLRYFKGALCSFREDILIKRETDFFMPNLYKTNSFKCGKKPWINKLTLEGIIVSYCLILLICGGPCHVFSLKNSVLGTLFSSENSLFIICFWVCIISSLILQILKFWDWILSLKVQCPTQKGCVKKHTKNKPIKKKI